MNYILLLKIGSIILICIILYVFLMKYIIQDGIQLKDSYMNSIRRCILRNNAEKIVNPIRDESFFRMKNDGDDPCDLKQDIKYVNYLEGYNLYMEMKKDDRNN